VDEQVRELCLERGEVLVRGEVTLGLRPAGDRVDDAVDQLPDAPLPSGLADVAAEVLADDDVGGELAPRGRNLRRPFCSKTVLPDSLPMLAVRTSQAISSYG
jgi:hypothetical protein